MPSPSWNSSQKHRFANESMAKAQAAHFFKDRRPLILKGNCRRLPRFYLTGTFTVIIPFN